MAALDIAGKDTAQLIQLYKETGDLTLRNIIVARNLRLAEGIASRFAGRGVEYEDLLQVASMALIGAIERLTLRADSNFPHLPRRRSSVRSKIISAIRRA